MTPSLFDQLMHEAVERELPAFNILKELQGMPPGLRADTFLSYSAIARGLAPAWEKFDAFIQARVKPRVGDAGSVVNKLVI